SSRRALRIRTSGAVALAASPLERRASRALCRKRPAVIDDFRAVGVVLRLRTACCLPYVATVSLLDTLSERSECTKLGSEGPTCVDGGGRAKSLQLNFRAVGLFLLLELFLMRGRCQIDDSERDRDDERERDGERVRFVLPVDEGAEREGTSTQAGQE